MSAGFYVAQDSHVVDVISPVDINGGKVGSAFGMRFHAHATIIIQIGVSAAAPTKIILNACSDAAGDNAVAIPYDIFAGETSNSDSLSGRMPQTSAGYSPSPNDGIFYVIEIDASQLPIGLPYVQLQITNGVNSALASAVAILSGGRYNDPGQTVLN